jgi:predicted nucleic acid-binding protein
MVLVDTSIWVSHFRTTRSDLAELLNNGDIVCHPFIIGELACGNLKDRTNILSLLEALPQAFMVEHDEVLSSIDSYKIMGKGLGYIDVHLLASALLTGIPLWIIDRKLDRVAEALHCGYR